MVGTAKCDPGFLLSKLFAPSVFTSPHAPNCFLVGVVASLTWALAVITSIPAASLFFFWVESAS